MRRRRSRQERNPILVASSATSLPRASRGGSGLPTLAGLRALRAMADVDRVMARLSAEITAQPPELVELRLAPGATLFLAQAARPSGFAEDLQLVVLTLIDEVYEVVVTSAKALYFASEWLCIEALVAVRFARRSRCEFARRRLSKALQAEAALGSRGFFAAASKYLREKFEQLAFGGVDDRDLEDFVLLAGYPYEGLTVETPDGHVLPLDRLPRKDSPKAVLFQHGVLDTAYAWIGTSSGGLTGNCAFTAFNGGCDVFLGNFRGTRDRRNVNEKMSAEEFWNFSINEHAMMDLASMLEHVRACKLAEGVSEAELEVVIVAHSLGGAAALMYVVNRLRAGREHGVNKLVLMSPAGVHRHLPLVCRLLGSVIHCTLARWLAGVRLPAKVLAFVLAKLVQDVRALPSTRDLASLVLAKVIGGTDISMSPFSKVGNMVFNVLLSGASTKLFRHFWQLYESRKFQMYDYGCPEKNLAAYGSPAPPDLLEHYELINIPVHFLCGSEDRLIPPEDVAVHFHALEATHPELAVMHVLDGVSHLSFTYAQNEQLISYISQHV